MAAQLQRDGIANRPQNGAPVHYQEMDLLAIYQAKI